MGIFLITTPLSSKSSTISNFHWQEAEIFSDVSLVGDRAISNKAPASGGRALSGAAFIKAGNRVQYELNLSGEIQNAKFVFRYARLHFREKMPPARFMLTVSTGSRSLHQEFKCVDTKGWGTLKASEWNYVEIPLHSRLEPGPVQVVIMAMEDGSNVNLDGFFVVPESFRLNHEETRNLERIQISKDGYRGLKIPGDTVFPGAFDGFEMIERSFTPNKSLMTASLIDEQGKKVCFMEPVEMTTDNHPVSHAVKSSELDQIPDGFYQLHVSFGEESEPLTFPLSILQNLVIRARLEGENFMEIARQFKETGTALEKDFIPDLEHAAEYLENTILVLEARQQGKSTTTERAAALAYFERSKARTARDFSLDMESLIDQTKLSLSNISKGIEPYKGRHGDFRRAFRSKATGALEPYRIFIPEAYASLDTIPLLLMLHGGGGDENYHPDLDDGVVKEILTERPHVMLSPRSTSWYEGPGLDDLVQLIRETLKNYSKIDATKVYSTGVSRGGWGSFRLALHDPDLLAGIACVSSAPNITDKVEELRGLPMLFINGGSDVVVDPDRARNMSKQLEARDLPHRLVIYPDAGHEYNTVEYLNLSLDFFDKK